MYHITIGTEKAEQLIRKHADMIYRIALHNLKNPSDAEDILQEVSLALITKCPDKLNDVAMKHWLIRVTINKCRSFLRLIWQQKPIVFVGGLFGYNAMKPKNHIFSLTANASELSDREFTPVSSLDVIGGEFYVNGATGDVALREGNGDAQTRILGLGITADSADETLPAEVRQAVRDWNDYVNTKLEDPVLQPGFDAAGFNLDKACEDIYTALLDRLTVTVTVTFSDGQVGVKSIAFQYDGIDSETGLMTISAKLQ